MGTVGNRTAQNPVRRQLVFGVHCRCPGCGGTGKERSRFDLKAGRWFAPKCARCSGSGIVPRQLASLPDYLVPR
jgi:uncharacterized protein (DUF983 family)